MKISIITVCYNAARTIRDALESVAAQAQGSGVEIEHIVVDGGSTDGTVREIEDFAKKVKGEGEEWNYSFRWVSEKDRGMYDAMNKGIRMATGEITLIVIQVSTM